LTKKKRGKKVESMCTEKRQAVRWPPPGRGRKLYYLRRGKRKKGIDFCDEGKGNCAHAFEVKRRKRKKKSRSLINGKEKKPTCVAALREKEKKRGFAKKPQKHRASGGNGLSRVGKSHYSSRKYPKHSGWGKR